MDGRVPLILDPVDVQALLMHVHNLLYDVVSRDVHDLLIHLL